LQLKKKETHDKCEMPLPLVTVQTWNEMKLHNSLDGKIRLSNDWPGHEKWKPEWFLLLPAIIYAGTGMCFTLVQNIGFVCLLCLFSLIHTTHTHPPMSCSRTASVKPEVPSMTFRFGTSR